MTELPALLEEKGIRKAVVIDDVFDDAPRPDELDEGDWSNFFDDLDNDGNVLLSELHAGYDNASTDDLKASQEFITVVWENRDKLPAVASKHLFSDYENTNATERKRLDALVTTLEGFGLTCSIMGRDFDESAKEADLVFVDLFLGFHQSEQDMKRAVCRVFELVADRTRNPPLVVLMSRSPRLREKRDEFRDSAGLLGSTFRVVVKAELAKDGRLETLLTRLASHYEDAKRVATFIHAWNEGLGEARENFLRILRRLDLSDLAQIRLLLLDFEGQKLGQYLLDVADRVLQHEIEAQAGTIAAAQKLNNIELDKYPAPHLAGSLDLQDLVHRMIFQHIERLHLAFDQDTPTIQYGDIVRRKKEDTGVLTKDVFLIVTPSCDLARTPIEHVLVLPGTLISLSPENWSCGATVTKTPVFASQNGSRYWIQWHIKGRHTICLTTLCEGLRNGNNYERLGRIRETYATEIQQKLLADMGRIGQPANPPATFPISISLYVVSANETARQVDVDELDTAICFVGRDATGDRVDHLVFREVACDALRDMIQEYLPDNVHTAAQTSLAAMKSDLNFFERFERGLIQVPQKNGKWQEEKGDNNRVYIHLVRNEGVGEGYAVKGNRRNAPFIMKISDVLPSQDE